MTERWRAIQDYPKYQVSTLGRVRRDGRVLKPVAVQCGSSPKHKPLYVSLSRSWHDVKKFKIARLVLCAFRGPSNGRIARHLNDNQNDNTLSNLRWGTHADNGADRTKNGLTCTGAKNGNSRLTEKQVLAMRRRYKKYSRDNNLVTLGREFGVNPGVVWCVVTRVTWRHLDARN